MSEKLTKKQKKTSEFRNKKRKLDDSIADVPEEDHAGEGAAETKDGDAVKTEDGKKKRRRGKGTKSSEAETPEQGGEEASADTPAKVQEKPKNQKFIVFVGNLPFNITKEQLQKHFESCGKISSVRVQSDKATGKGKGFAFMEFGDSESMQKALFFNKTLIKERPINVELTAGGGGNKSTRKQKIAVKNEALNEERRKVHEKHIAPAKEAKSSYAKSQIPVVVQAPKKIKRPNEISGANAINVMSLSDRLRKA
ncbi:hypothetical protein BGW38_004935 [Lunasporangiospora selenospora]|uniref:RRM domain-containing protein n=1 Tax=Lunasporangiospora selenospora TaxID=979761 RepID=A0A9P6KBT5_9FUNG|nr:hypothetical protein BGW38_004935 [Lunasporangiospora selenospora]